MEERNIEGFEGFNGEEGTSNEFKKVNLPVEVSPWTKVKNFLCYEIKLELTPVQKKVFQEVHDFWHIEITGQDFKDFLLQPITGKDVHDFLFQEITFGKKA